jgi:hypothetical protein
MHAPLSKKGSCAADMVRLHIRDPKGNSFEPQVACLHPSSINSKTNGGPTRPVASSPAPLLSPLPCLAQTVYVHAPMNGRVGVCARRVGVCARYAAWQWQRRASLMQQCRVSHPTVSQVQKVIVIRMRDR